MKKGLPKIIAIVGPTATGKSGLAIKIAKKINGEIVSADSRQVYRGLNIGTGKVTKKEMGGIKHHGLDISDPNKQISVTDYKKYAQGTIESILKKRKIPIVCGGTGFYIDTLLRNISLPDALPNLKLRKDLEKKSANELYTILLKLDRERAENIDRKNGRRLIRAIEIAKILGKNPKINEVAKYEVLYIGIMPSKEILKKNIYKRLVLRLKKGMVNEAEKLHNLPGAKKVSFRRMRELGLEYRYLAKYLQKQITKDELVEKLNTEIWHYAKRQITWFKRNKEINWFEDPIKNFSPIYKTTKEFIDRQSM